MENVTGFVNMSAPAPVQAVKARPEMPKAKPTVEIKTAAQKKAEADIAATYARSLVSVAKVDAPAPAPVQTPVKASEPAQAAPVKPAGLPMGKYVPWAGCRGGVWHGTPPEHREPKAAWRRQPGYRNGH